MAENNTELSTPVYLLSTDYNHAPIVPVGHQNDLEINEETRIIIEISDQSLNIGSQRVYMNERSLDTNGSEVMFQNGRGQLNQRQINATNKKNSSHGSIFNEDSTYHDDHNLPGLKLNLINERRLIQQILGLRSHNALILQIYCRIYIEEKELECSLKKLIKIQAGQAHGSLNKLHSLPSTVFSAIKNSRQIKRQRQYKLYEKIAKNQTEILKLIYELLERNIPLSQRANRAFKDYINNIDVLGLRSDEYPEMLLFTAQILASGVSENNESLQNIEAKVLARRLCAKLGDLRTKIIMIMDKVFEELTFKEKKNDTNSHAHASNSSINKSINENKDIGGRVDNQKPVTKNPSYLLSITANMVELQVDFDKAWVDFERLVCFNTELQFWYYNVRLEPLKYFFASLNGDAFATRRGGSSNNSNTSDRTVSMGASGLRNKIISKIFGPPSTAATNTTTSALNNRPQRNISTTMSRTDSNPKPQFEDLLILAVSMSESYTNALNEGVITKDMLLDMDSDFIITLPRLTLMKNIFYGILSDIKANEELRRKYKPFEIQEIDPNNNTVAGVGTDTSKNNDPTSNPCINDSSFSTSFCNQPQAVGLLFDSKSKLTNQVCPTNTENYDMACKVIIPARYVFGDIDKVDFLSKDDMNLGMLEKSWWFRNSLEKMTNLKMELIDFINVFHKRVIERYNTNTNNPIAGKRPSIFESVELISRYICNAIVLNDVEAAWGKLNIEAPLLADPTANDLTLPLENKSNSVSINKQSSTNPPGEDTIDKPAKGAPACSKAQFSSNAPKTSPASQPQDDVNAKRAPIESAPSNLGTYSNNDCSKTIADKGPKTKCKNGLGSNQNGVQKDQPELYTSCSKNYRENSGFSSGSDSVTSQNRGDCDANVSKNFVCKDNQDDNKSSIAVSPENSVVEDIYLNDKERREFNKLYLDICSIADQLHSSKYVKPFRVALQRVYKMHNADP